MDLEVPRADRRLHPAPVAAGLRERPGDGGLTRTVEPQHAPRWSLGAREYPPHRLRLERPRPQTPQLPGRARHDDDDTRRRHPARRPAPCRRARGRWRPRAGSPACGHPARNRCTGGASARRTTREICSISRSSSSSTTSARPVTAATSSIVRSSCVGPSPPDTSMTSASSPPLSAERSSSGPSPTMVIGPGSSPSDSACARVERPVQVGPLAAHELAAGDDDGRARAGQRDQRRLSGAVRSAGSRRPSGP